MVTGSRTSRDRVVARLLAREWVTNSDIVSLDIAREKRRQDDVLSVLRGLHGPVRLQRGHNVKRSDWILRAAGMSVVAAMLIAPTVGGAAPLGDVGKLPVQQASTPSLGSAQRFAVLGGSTVTNTGSTVITGDLGVSPGSAVIGFPPGDVDGEIHEADGAAANAQADVTETYNTLEGLPCDVNLTGQDLGGLTLTPGVYCFDSSAQLTGALTLDALGDPDAEFVFQIGSALTTASDSSVTAINGGPELCNLFWQVGSSATLGTDTSFLGNVVALTSITLTTDAELAGRALARNGAVTLDTNTVSSTRCSSGGGGGGDDNSDNESDSEPSEDDDNTSPPAETAASPAPEATAVPPADTTVAVAVDATTPTEGATTAPEATATVATVIAAPAAGPGDAPVAVAPAAGPAEVPVAAAPDAGQSEVPVSVPNTTPLEEGVPVTGPTVQPLPVQLPTVVPLPAQVPTVLPVMVQVPWVQADTTDTDSAEHSQSQCSWRQTCDLVVQGRLDPNL